MNAEAITSCQPQLARVWARSSSVAVPKVRLLICWAGGGIPQEQINRIFEPFYTTKKKGSGLGLMIVQRIVRAHGGRIELESQVGRGTTFRVWLPLHERKPRLLEAPLHD